ncbi:MAG: hypothetical protein ACMUIP_13210 [bacterium]
MDYETCKRLHTKLILKIILISLLGLIIGIFSLIVCLTTTCSRILIVLTGALLTIATVIPLSYSVSKKTYNKADKI